jgi:hypothetical protein
VTEALLNDLGTSPRHGLWIEIPALSIALPVSPGDGSDRIPMWKALVYPGTAWPGDAGNSYVYAHAYCGMFGGLLYAGSGDAGYLRFMSSSADQGFPAGSTFCNVGSTTASRRVKRLAMAGRSRPQPRPEWQNLLQRSRSDPSLVPRSDPREKGSRKRTGIIPARRKPSRVSDS